MQADEGRGLRQREIDAERHAEVIPGKAREQEAARPLGDPEPKREGENARWSGRPQEARKRKSRGRKHGERRGQRYDGERQRPGEFVGLDEQRRAHPPEAGEKIAKTHPPARAERGAERPSGAAVVRAIEEPHGDGQRDGDQRK